MGLLICITERGNKISTDTGIACKISLKPVYIGKCYCVI